MDWQPIETAPVGGTLIVGSLIIRGEVWRVFDCRHSGLAWYSKNGMSVPIPTHWIPLPKTQKE